MNSDQKNRELMQLFTLVNLALPIINSFGLVNGINIIYFILALFLFYYQSSLRDAISKKEKYKMNSDKKIRELMQLFTLLNAVLPIISSFGLVSGINIISFNLALFMFYYQSSH